jgi:hypothetical protein
VCDRQIKRQDGALLVRATDKATALQRLHCQLLNLNELNIRQLPPCSANV